MLDITRSLKPPRATFLDFPPGHTTGPPFDPALQHAIVASALRHLVTAAASGEIQELPIRWPAGDTWKESPLPPRLPRDGEPQYQSDNDAAAAHADEFCPICRVS